MRAGWSEAVGSLKAEDRRRSSGCEGGSDAEEEDRTCRLRYEIRPLSPHRESFVHAGKSLSTHGEVRSRKER